MSINLWMYTFIYLLLPLLCYRNSALAYTFYNINCERLGPPTAGAIVISKHFNFYIFIWFVWMPVLCYSRRATIYGESLSNRAQNAFKRTRAFLLNWIIRPISFISKPNTHNGLLLHTGKPWAYRFDSINDLYLLCHSIRSMCVVISFDS